MVEEKENTHVNQKEDKILVKLAQDHQTSDQLDRLMDRALILEAKILRQLEELDDDGLETIDLGNETRPVADKPAQATNNFF
jgi:hypothetical protein